MKSGKSGQNIFLQCSIYIDFHQHTAYRKNSSSLVGTSAVDKSKDFTIRRKLDKPDVSI